MGSWRPGSADVSRGAAEAADSKHHLSLRSSLDLPRHLQLDAGYRYVSRITNPNLLTPGYSQLDVRLGWEPVPRLEISVVGQNLLHERHAEFGSAAAAQGIERGVFAKAVWGFWGLGGLPAWSVHHGDTEVARRQQQPFVVLRGCLRVLRVLRGLRVSV